MFSLIYHYFDSFGIIVTFASNLMKYSILTMQLNVADHIINDSFFDYISKNIDCNDTSRLILKRENVDFDKKFAVLQIECRNKTKNKLPEILKFEKYLFPKSISAEQCTPEQVAKFHGELFAGCHHVLDMTMGLGVDSFYIAQNANTVTSLEIDREIAEIGKFNFSHMAHNITVINADSVDFISNCSEFFSSIFIDPARRDANNKRMFGFADCMPNVIDLLPHIKRCTNRLIIKASPMLDISKSILELQFVTDIWILGIKNSCKELLFSLDFSQNAEIKAVNIHAINFDSIIRRTDFQHLSTPDSPDNHFATPSEGNILFEPNACIMKSGRTSQLLSLYPSLEKIDVSSHLFLVSDANQLSQLPGRCFTIDKVIPFKDKELKQLRVYKELNVATRNFKLTAEQLKSRLRVKDGGNNYLFGTTLHNGDMVLLLCAKATK